MKRKVPLLIMLILFCFLPSLKVDAGNPEEPFEPAKINLPDGEYAIEVTMTGGSGRASLSSPTLFIVKDKKAYAKIIWSSTHYDYMIVGGKKMYNETTDGGNSTYTIPIKAFDEPMPVIGDTTAMGDPVAINYELTFYKESINGKGYVPQEAAKRVVIFAIILIVVGGILNYIVNRRRKA